MLVVGLAANAAAVAAGIASPAGVVVLVGAALASGRWFRSVAAEVPGVEMVGLLRLALGLKALAIVPRFVTRVDAEVYHRVGAALADRFRSGDFLVPTGRSIPGTGTVRYVTGLVELVTFGDEYATFVVFALFGFAGVVWFVRAFARAFPEVSAHRYAALVLLWPSLVYWPSSTGKEALMVGALGLAARGLATVLAGRVRGLAPFAAGLALVGLVRPHVALIAVTAALVAVLVRSGRREGHMAVGRLVLVGVLVVGGAMASNAVEALLDIDGLDASGLSRALELAQQRSSQGGSSFTPARIDGPLDVPWGTVTVLLRPFPWEAHNPAMAVTGVEGLALGLLGLAAIPRLVAGLGRLRSEPYLAYAVVFVVVFVWLFSALANFGILARQRTMALPLVLVVLGLPTARRRVQARRRGERA